MGGWGHERRTCLTRMAFIVKRREVGTISMDILNQEEEGCSYHDSKHQRGGRGGASRLLCDKGSTGTTPMATPAPRRIGTPRWPRYSRLGERARPLGERARVPHLGSERALGEDRKEGNPKRTRKGQGQAAGLSPVLSLRGLGALAKWYHTKEWTPHGQRKGKRLTNPSAHNAEEEQNLEDQGLG